MNELEKLNSESNNNSRFEPFTCNILAVYFIISLDMSRKEDHAKEVAEAI